MMPVFGADNTVPPRVDKEKTTEHAKSNMQYKLSMKNKSMRIKAAAGIQIDLPDTKNSNEKTKFKTTYGTKALTKSKGTKIKAKTGIRTR
jgi:hypothetical protein